MKKRVFIIHGWEGNPNESWFPWIKEELEKNDFEVAIPQMPNANFPRWNEWLLAMQEIIKEPDKNTFLIGHSLGVIAVLRFLESLSLEQKVEGAILVAGFSEVIDIPEIANFFDNPVEYEKIKSSCKNFVVINSDDDPYVPLKKGEILRDKLNAKFIVLHNAGHINTDAGCFELPIALEGLLKITKK